MGQQQLLLVILVTILVGIATVVAINVFGDAAEQGNRDAVRQDLLQAAAGAQAVWSKPTLLGGAGRDFAAVDTEGAELMTDADILRLMGIPGSLSTEGDEGEETDVVVNENGTYSIAERTERQLVILGEPSTFTNNLRLTVTRTEEGNWTVNIAEEDS